MSTLMALMMSTRLCLTTVVRLLNRVSSWISTVFILSSYTTGYFFSAWWWKGARGE